MSALEKETPDEERARKKKENRVLAVFAVIAAFVIAYYSVVYRNDKVAANAANAQRSSASASANASATPSPAASSAP